MYIIIEIGKTNIFLNENYINVTKLYIEFVLHLILTDLQLMCIEPVCLLFLLTSKVG